MNCYMALEDLKNRLNVDPDAEDAHWSDIELLTKLRFAYKKVWMNLGMKRGNWLGTSSLVTASSGVITLPDDCGKIQRIEEVSTNYPIKLNAFQQIRDYYPQRADGFNDSYLAGSLFGNTIKMLADDYSSQVRIFYDKRFVAPICGTADSGTGTDSLVLKLADRPSMVDDDYNSVVFAFMAGGGVGTYATASDYVGSTRTVTITGSYSTSTIYGTVFEIPEEANEVVILEAAKNAASKPASHLKDEYYRLIRSDAKEAWNAFEEWAELRLKDNQNIGIG